MLQYYHVLYRDYMLGFYNPYVPIYNNYAFWQVGRYQTEESNLSRNNFIQPMGIRRTVWSFYFLHLVMAHLRKKNSNYTAGIDCWFTQLLRVSGSFVSTQIFSLNRSSIVVSIQIYEELCFLFITIVSGCICYWVNFRTEYGLRSPQWTKELDTSGSVS